MPQVTPVTPFPQFPPPRPPGLLGLPNRRECFPMDCTPHLLKGFRFARAAAWHGLGSLGLQKGDRVLMPLYHHGVEVETVKSLGLQVDYYPVGRDLSPSIDSLRAQIRERTKVLYVTHYFGFPQPVLALRDFCRDRGMYLFEDCALALFSNGWGMPLGSTGDLSVFCLYKTLPVPDGGLLCVNMEMEGTTASSPGHDLRSWFSHAYSLGRCWSGRGMVVKRAMCRDGAGTWTDLPLANRHVGVQSVPAEERTDGESNRVSGGALRGRESPSMYVLEEPGCPNFSANHQVHWSMSPVTRALLRWADGTLVRKLRRRNYSFWAENISLISGMEPLFPELPSGVCPLFFPVMVEDKAGLCKRLKGEGIMVNNWWPTAVGGQGRGVSPWVDRLRDCLVGLPVHQLLSADDLERTLYALRGQVPPWR